MLSIGWNGTPPGFENECEILVPQPRGKLAEWETKPEVIHAERNAIDKMTRQGVPTQGSILFVTCAPCFECAKAIHGLGLKAVYYDEEYRCEKGLQLLRQAGVFVSCRKALTIA
jgi:dCMP deaminase